MCISCEHPQCGICQSCHAGISEARAIFLQHGIQMHRTAALFHPGCQARVYRGILHLILGRVSDLRRKAHRKCVYLFRTLSFPVLYCVMHGHGRTDLTWVFFFFADLVAYSTADKEQGKGSFRGLSMCSACNVPTPPGSHGSTTSRCARCAQACIPHYSLLAHFCLTRLMPHHLPVAYSAGDCGHYLRRSSHVC